MRAALVPAPRQPGARPGQTFAVVLTGAALGANRGAAGQILYVGLGLGGLPFYADASSGPSVVFGATDGYILAFPLAAWVTGKLAEARFDRTPLKALPAFTLGSVIVFLIGVPWLAVAADLSLGKAIELGFVPFVPGGLVKAAPVAGAREHLAGRAIWHVNSTARGGGVAEMLMALLPYAHGVGVDARWVVIRGTPAFFTVTKRIHNLLHGSHGDGGELGEAEREAYESAVERNAAELVEMVSGQDIVVLHDPQTAGLIPHVKATGAAVVWRCHVGIDQPNARSRTAWRFLRGYVEQADAYVFSRDAFVWEDLDRSRGRIIAPSIDAFAPKNQEVDDLHVATILAHSGIVDEPANGDPPEFVRMDGTTGSVVTGPRCSRLRRCSPATATCCRCRAGTASRTRPGSSRASPTTWPERRTRT